MNKTMKIRMLSLLLCFVMLIGMLPAPVVSAIAAETVASGVSESAAWSLDSNGLFVIDGGAMADYAAAADRPWHAYAEQIKKVGIGNGVTRVGDYAFAGCTNLTEVEIGNSVNTIGAYSFEDTASLTEVVMPKNVKVFCDGMFHNSGLKKLYIYSRYTEFEGFYSVGYDEDNVLPLDTVVYCYASTHAYFYFNRTTVVLVDDPVMDVDNGDSTIAMNPHQSNFVRDLWTAAETQDGLVFDYNLSMTTADVLRVHNEMVAQNNMIGPDYNNDGKLAVEVQISLRNTFEELAWIRAGADYSFFAYNLENGANDNYKNWSGWSNEEQFITVTGDADSVAVDINATMQELEDYAGEPVSEIFVYVSVKGISYKYNGRYESADKTTTVESNSVSIYDAHRRESEVPLEGMMTPDKSITVLDYAPDYGLTEEEYAKYYEPVSRHYEWSYRIGREGWFYDEETDTDIYPGMGFWELSEGMFTELYNGVLYGGVAGSFDAGSDASVSLREMLPAEHFSFVETLRGVEARGMGGEVTIELLYTLTVTYADGTVVVLEGQAADETTSIAGICLHTCTVCGMCTGEDLLACNSRYGQRINECTCEVSSPAIESSSVEDVEVVDSNAWCGNVTSHVETFDVETAVTTDYFKAVINSVGSANVAAVYDITLYNEWGEAYIINEWGGTEEYVTLSIPVSAEIAQAAANGELALYHVDKNGSAELVDITADTGNNTLTFTGTSFSPYVLVEVLQYYGRQQLATLPNSTALLYAYDQLAAGVETSAENITVCNGTDAITQAEFEMVMDAYRRDYAHHFWLGNSYQILSDATSVVSILPTYIMAGTDLEAAKTAFEQKVTDILSGITSTMSEYEKELYLHDRLAERITYAEAANAHNAYGALVDGKAVCEGYAEALQYLLQRVGIQSFLAVGAGINPVTNAAENHEWNYVKIDGKYYHVDLTWDDQGEKLFHAYFNQTDALMQEDHVIATTGYGLPVCNSTTAQYFTGKDEYLQSYTAAEVGQLLKDNALKVHVYIPGSVNNFISWYQTNIVQIGTEAGVTGGFSYGYTKLGREVVIYLKPDHVHTCTWGDWSDNKDGTHTGSCSCGATQTQNCTYDNGTVTAPTCTAQGYTTYTCTLCGGSYVADLQDALDHSYVNGFCTGCGQFGAAAGETVRLSADQNATELTIPAGVTLDLNGYCLEAETLVSFGDIIDTAGTGSLVVGDFVLSDNSYLPVFNSENGCYRFFAYSLEALGVRAGEGTATFGFALNFADPAAYMLLTRTQDPKLNITTELAWEDETLTFAFSPELIRQFAALQLRYPELQAALQLKVTGLESLDTPLTVTSELAAVDGQITKKTNSIEH